MRNYIIIAAAMLTLFSSISIIAGSKSCGYSDRIFCHYRYNCHPEWTKDKIDELDKRHDFWLGIEVLFQLQNMAIIVLLVLLWLCSKETCQKCEMEKKCEENLNKVV